jgi:NAD(P)H-dependent FMN reductase
MNKIAIISGSHRKRGASTWITTALGQLAAQHVSDCSTEQIDLTEVPLWDEGLWGDPKEAPRWDGWQEIAERLLGSDGFIIVAPEYAGMVPPRLTNFLLLCSGREVGHKPALAVSVSSTRGGAYPITQLRAYGSKNNHLCWLPDHLIVRDAQDDGPPESLYGTGYTARYAVYCLKLLDSYATALKTVRATGCVDHGSYPYGM